MAEYTGTVSTHKSQEDAFAYMAAFEHTSEWDPNCVSAERLTPGDVGVGTRFKLVFNPVASTEMELDYEVIEYDAPRRIVLKADTGTIQSTDTIEVEARGGGSAVTYNANLEGEGAAKLAGPLLAIGIKRAGQEAESGLEERLNA
jgi:hypothetical protein